MGDWLNKRLPKLNGIPQRTTSICPGVPLPAGHGLLNFDIRAGHCLELTHLPLSKGECPNSKYKASAFQATFLARTSSHKYVRNSVLRTFYLGVEDHLILVHLLVLYGPVPNQNRRDRADAYQSEVEEQQQR